jgi:hypothetical protein
MGCDSPAFESWLTGVLGPARKWGRISIQLTTKNSIEQVNPG